MAYDNPQRERQKCLLTGRHIIMTGIDHNGVIIKDSRDPALSLGS